MKKLIEWFGTWLPGVWAVLATFCITAWLFGGCISAVLWVASLLGGM